LGTEVCLGSFFLSLLGYGGGKAGRSFAETSRHNFSQLLRGQMIIRSSTEDIHVAHRSPHVSPGSSERRRYGGVGQ
jgi:hypothetical protein